MAFLVTIESPVCVLCCVCGPSIDPLVQLSPSPYIATAQNLLINTKDQVCDVTAPMWLNLTAFSIFHISNVLLSRNKLSEEIQEGTIFNPTPRKKKQVGGCKCQTLTYTAVKSVFGSQDDTLHTCMLILTNKMGQKGVFCLCCITGVKGKMHVKKVSVHM